MVNVLVLGKGGREHALAWALLKSPKVAHVFLAPGNAGTWLMAKCTNLDLQPTDFPGILEAVRKHHITLTVVGPEDPLVAGVADFLRSHGHLVFGPGAEAARVVEGSKSAAKELMQKYGITTGNAMICTDYQSGLQAIDRSALPVVIKADGLAAGKGVKVCSSREEARGFLHQLMVDNVLSSAGQTVLVEEFLEGCEASLLVVTDGVTAIPLLPAQDYKRAFTGDLGDNTGGMGAFAPVLDNGWVREAMVTIVAPFLHALEKEGIHYSGVLYVGLMLTDGGPKVVEFNCRFGDPETQVVLPLLESDFYDLCFATAQGLLTLQNPLTWYEGSCVGVVLVSGGYPGKYQGGYPIKGIPMDAPDAVVFHAGTEFRNGMLVTAGGRVLTAVGRGPTLASAQYTAYRVVDLYAFRDMYYRSDIASSAID